MRAFCKAIVCLLWLTTVSSLHAGNTQHVEAELQGLQQRATMYRAELAAGTGDSGTLPALLDTLAELRRVITKTSPESDQLRVIEEEVIQVAEQWIRQRPDDLGGYVALLRWGDPDSLHATVQAIEARFGERLPDLQSAAHDLRQRGYAEPASGLLERYAARRPQDPDVYQALIDHFETLSAESRAGAAARSWYERFPDDPRAQRHHLRYNHRSMGEKELSDLTTRVVESIPSTPHLKRVCDDLEHAGAVSQAASCWLQAEAAAAPRKLAYMQQKAMIRTLAADGNVEQLLRIVRQAKETGGSWLWEAVHQLEATRQCEALERFLADPATRAERYFDNAQITRSMSRCDLASTGERILELLRTESSEHLSGLLSSDRMPSMDVDRAEETLLDRLYGDPTNPGLQNALADLYRHSGQPEKLLAHFIDWASHDPSNPEPALSAAILLSGRGQNEQARAWMEDALARDPAEARQYTLALETLRRLDAPDRAAELAGRLAISDDSRLADEGRRQLLILAVEQDRPEEAMALYGELQTAGKNRVDDDIAYLSAMQNAERLDEALETIERDVRQKLAAGSLEGNVHAALGSRLALLKRWNLAVDHFRKALEAAPDNVDLNMRLATALGKLGRGSEAEAAYRRVLELSPEHEKALAALAFLLQDREDFAGVVELLEPVAADGRLKGQAAVVLGHAYLRLERPDDAVTQLERTVSEQPVNHQAYLSLATAYDQLDRPQDAEPAFSRFLKLTDWSETRVGECNCSCGLPGQRAAAKKWLETDGQGPWE